MAWNAGILLSHNPSATPGHSFTSASLLPRQHLGWVWLWWWMHTHTHTRLWAQLLQWNRWTYECSWDWQHRMWKVDRCLVFVSSKHTKLNLLLPLYSEFMLYCSFTLKVNSPLSVFSFSSRHGWEKPRGASSNKGTRRPPEQDIKPHLSSGGLIIDVSTHKFTAAF